MEQVLQKGQAGLFMLQKGQYTQPVDTNQKREESKQTKPNQTNNNNNSKGELVVTIVLC